ncbi:MAG TPA: DUF6049 family protein [Acidimicrobiales bacterium]|nr:DUF6049 family protein [Acidimicrobiales bacterium]
MSRSRPSTRHRRRPRGRWRRRPSLPAAGLLVLVLTLLAGPPAGAGTPEGGPPVAGAGSSAQPSRSGGRLELVEQPAWVYAGDAYDVTVRVDDAPAGAALDLVVHERLESRSQFRATLEGDLGDVEHQLEPRPVGALPTRAPGEVTIGLPVGGGGTGLSGRGVYPVEVRLLSADGEVLDSVLTYLSYLRDRTAEYPPLGVAVLVDVGTEHALQPDGTWALPPGALERAEERVELLRSTAGVPLTLAPRPETIEALAQDEDAGRSTVEQLASATAGRPVFARPFVGVDLAALQRAGLLSEAAAQADGGANVVRSRLAREPLGGMWLAGETLGELGAATAVELGLGRAVVPVTAVDDGDGDDDADVPLTPVALGDSGLVGVVVDPELSDALVGADGPVDVPRFLAELAITWLEAPSIPRVVTVWLPGDEQIAPDVVAEALRALGTGHAVRPMAIDEVFDEVGPPEEGPDRLELAPHPVDDDLVPLASRVRRARSRVAGVEAALGSPGSTRLLQHLLLMGTGVDTPDAQRDAYLTAAETDLEAVTGAVTLPEEFRITLTAREATIPVTLTNHSERDLTVRVEVDSDQLEFPDGDEFVQTLEPGTTRLEVPVRTRTSGAFTMAVTVTSPDGTVVLDTSTFDVRSTAISGVGLVLSIGAALFLAVWWARHWRSTRRSRHLVPANPHRRRRRDARRRTTTVDSTDDDEDDYRPAHLARPRSRSR